MKILIPALLLLFQAGCLFFHGQRYHHFVTKTPLPENDLLIIGFLGGRDSWDDSRRAVRKLALKLRSMKLHGVHVETVENKKRQLAIRLIRNAFDFNQDNQLDKEERSKIRLILYGQSFGGAAVIKLAWQLQEMNIPVLLTVQIDSVGRGDDVIPANVLSAANLFQKNGLIIRGESEIRPEDPRKTKVIGNFEYDYRNRKIDLSEIPLWKKLFRFAHTKMELDPAVWSQVERMILDISVVR